MKYHKETLRGLFHVDVFRNLMGCICLYSITYTHNVNDIVLDELIIKS